MGTTGQSELAKMANNFRQNPGEFKVINGKLNCLLCYSSDNIRYDKQYYVDRHRNSKDPQQKLQQINNLEVQDFCVQNHRSVHVC